MLSKRIRINDVENDMILAKDIINKNGIIIASKDTVLSESYIDRLRANCVDKVTVWSDFKKEDSLLFAEDLLEIALEEYNKPIEERKEFQKFRMLYEKNVDFAKNDFIAICEGGKSDSDFLFDIVSSMLEDLNSKSDVVNYLYHLEQSYDYTYRHSLNVAVLCYLFAVWAKMSKEDTKILTLSGILHDIGKLLISKEVLCKKGALTKMEFEEVKKHTSYGYMLLFEQNLPDEVKLAALMHHEKIDGSGYPLGVSGKRIDRFAKIVSICDIYDAMTSTRTYHRKKCPFDVIKMFEQNEYGMLDVENMVAFLRNIAYSYLGNKVRLSDKRVGEIVFVNQNYLSRPIIKIGNDFINLVNEVNLNIEDIL